MSENIRNGGDSLSEMTIRERTEAQERAALSEYACRSAESLGRERDEPKCPIRTDFQRDRDRILHCNAYRRLTHKTQVFLCPVGDHYRTRLTHTLEVSQIARTIARALRLNEDLTEAIALGHDLGHTPFGHAGERSLDRINPDGYRHYVQSVRVVEKLEKDGRGLNLTRETRDGILCHTEGRPADTLEGRVVRLADKIAYINHDIEDAIRAGVLCEEDIPESSRKILGGRKTERITTLVLSIVDASQDKPDIAMTPQIAAEFETLKRFMYEAVYTNPVAKAQEGKAEELVSRLYEHYLTRPDELPEEFRGIYEREGAHRAACDYISGMSDRYAVDRYEKLFVPTFWTEL